jgi:hypothetical protein
MIFALRELCARVLAQNWRPPDEHGKSIHDTAAIQPWPGMNHAKPMLPVTNFVDVGYSQT